MKMSLQCLLQILALVLLLHQQVAFCQKSFSGFSVLRMTPDTDGKVKFLKSLAYNFDTDVSFQDKIDFWRRPKDVNYTVDLMVSPDVKEDIRRLLKEQEVNHREMISDVESLIQAEKGSHDESDLKYRNKAFTEDAYAFAQDYHRLNEIHDYMNDMAQMYPDRVKIKNIGKSSEGRDMLLWIIGNKSPTGAQKDIIWIDSGIHAREWISPATGVFLATHVRIGVCFNDISSKCFMLSSFKHLFLTNSETEILFCEASD